MTTQDKIARAKLSILELAEYLKNVSLRPAASMAFPASTSMMSGELMTNTVSKDSGTRHGASRG